MTDIEKSINVDFDSNLLEDDPRPVRALCIHGHFYQPPRENPLTGIIPEEIGAAPYPNWNVRIHTECYQPNATLGNFERISFNVGPTLFKWMEKYDPITTRRIIEQDRSNVKRFGVGNAMAQAYNHTILPLASKKDKDTQIYWSVADFLHRFGRPPKGMWLPETAVDIETLETLVDHGIEFTILAPWQAADPAIDPTEPYFVHLPSKRKIAVFFYQKELSGGISFNPRMTTNAHFFALKELIRFFNATKYSQGENQLLLLASDGELYGHHQSLREWFLAYLVNGAGARAGIRLTYPALWLRDNPPKNEVKILERTSWSCHHGVHRWWRDCDCNPGNGTWKWHLRRALNNFSKKVDQLYMDYLNPFGIEPWQLRNRYIHVLLEETSLVDIIHDLRDRVKDPNSRDIDDRDRTTIRMLLEAQRERQRMFTSCGWFFEDLNRIEPLNNIAYAAQAANLVFKATGVDLTPDLLEDLSLVRSQRSSTSGDEAFDRFWRSYF